MLTMNRRINGNHYNGIIELDLDSEIIDEETLAQLVDDDEQSWLSSDSLNSNHHQNKSNGHTNNNNSHCDDDDDDPTNKNCDITECLSDVLENEAYRSSRDNLARELNNIAVLHKLQSSNKFGRMAMPEKNLETRWESKLECKDAKLDTRTITKRKPTIFNRFSSTEELSSNNGSNTNLRSSNKLNYSSHNISGSSSNLSNHLSGSNTDLESTFTMRRTKLNNTFTMDENEKYDNCFSTRREHFMQQQQHQQPHQHIQQPGRGGLNGLIRRTSEEQLLQQHQQSQSVKKKPISMYSVYAEPTDSRPIRSTNTSMLSAYRLFKSSTLNRQYEYRDDEFILNNNLYSPDYSTSSRKTSTPIASNTVSTARMIKRNGTFTCNKPSLPRYNGSFIPKPK